MLGMSGIPNMPSRTLAPVNNEKPIWRKMAEKIDRTANQSRQARL